MSKPKVSVVIPYWNAGEYIEETLDSVEKQTYEGLFEVIIVDDGSDDKDSIERLLKIERERRVRVIRQKNAGLSAARNKGIKESKGEFIAVLDSDDLFDPNYLKETVTPLEEDKTGKLGFVTTYVQSFGISNELWETSDYTPENRIMLLAKNIICGNSVFLKEAWEKSDGYNTNMVGGYEDWDFWIGLVEAGYIWKRIPKPLFNYRKRAGSMLTNSVKIHDTLFPKIVANHPEIYKKHHQEVIKLLSSLWMNREQVIKEQNKFMGTRFFAFYDSFRKIAGSPKRLLNPKNYRKFIERLKSR